MQSFDATRFAGLDRLRRFLPKAAGPYAAQRNYDNGPGAHETAVSTLSPYIRHRLLTEEDVLGAVLRRYSLKSAEKFVQEVFWRTYWKGWLQMRPSVWTSYRVELRRRHHDLATQSGLRQRWEAACLGDTGIDAFDHWAHELASTGYLHNHARMWFASIWIFTLKLPWELGADFFLRHLLDGDPAANTLSWRWVAGLQTHGKTYLARPDNIAKYTNGRFDRRALDAVLAPHAAPLQGPEHPPRLPPPQITAWDPQAPSALLLTSEDLSPGWLFEAGLNPCATATWHDANILSCCPPVPHVTAFKTAALCDVTTRWENRLGAVTACETVQELTDWAGQTQAHQIVTAFAPTGPTAEMLTRLQECLAKQGQVLVTPLRPYDAMCWPHATHGFFRFKEKLPQFVTRLRDKVSA